jgi:hypothetical protein
MIRTKEAEIAAELAHRGVIQHYRRAVGLVPAVRRTNLANAITGQIYSSQAAVAYAQGSAPKAAAPCGYAGFLRPDFDRRLCLEGH